MTELLTFILCAYGLTQILVYGKILDRVRPTTGHLGELFKCPMCIGFHVGWFLFAINEWTELFTFDYTIANFFICGWVGAGTSYILSMIVGDEGIRVDKGTTK